MVHHYLDAEQPQPEGVHVVSKSGGGVESLPAVVEAARLSSPVSAPTSGEGVPAAPPPSSSYTDDQRYCPRCGQNTLLWVSSSYYCSRCHFKEGCCNGEVGDDY